MNFFGLRRQKQSVPNLRSGGSVHTTVDKTSIYTFGHNTSLNTLHSSTISGETAEKILQVVVIGGSISGLAAIRYIEFYAKRNVRIKLIEEKERMFYRSGMLAGLIDSSILPNLSIANRNVFKYKHNLHIVGKAKKIKREFVELETGDLVFYDIIVIATGCEYPCDNWIEASLGRSRLESFLLHYQALKVAKSILIIGGGASGVEMAFRLMKEFSGKTITIIHENKTILDGDYTDSYRKKIVNKLLSNGIQLVLNEKAKISNYKSFGYPFKGRWIETNSGKLIFSDIQLNFTSPIAKPEFLRQFEPDSFDYIDQSTGFILVNRGLQVIGHSNIFAIGDCNNIKGPKSESRSLSQAQCIGKTIGQWALTHAAKRPYLKVLPETWAADCESALLSIISNEKKEIGLYLSNGFSDTYKLKSYRKFEIDIKKTEGLKNLAKLVGSGIRGSFNN